MDHKEPGRDDLTEQEWAAIFEWAHKMWWGNADTPEWALTSECILAVRKRGIQVPLITAFTHPELCRPAIRAVYIEYMTRILTGEK
jgi:hypothetical protein